MNIANRIQSLRKSKGISQEELAEQIQVSRQAVSKWESEQSVPELERIVAISEYFGVSTDYILKGTVLEDHQPKKDNKSTSQILYVASTAFIFIGLFCGFGGWYSDQTISVVWGSMIIQAIGGAGYFIGRALSSDKPSFFITWLNIVISLFMPLSMLTGILSLLLFKQGDVAPYPLGPGHIIFFALFYILLSVLAYRLLKKYRVK